MEKRLLGLVQDSVWDSSHEGTRVESLYKFLHMILSCRGSCVCTMYFFRLLDPSKDLPLL